MGECASAEKLESELQNMGEMTRSDGKDSWMQLGRDSK